MKGSPDSVVSEKLMAKCRKSAGCSAVAMRLPQKMTWSKEPGEEVNLKA
jgi:hypothetical protein